MGLEKPSILMMDQRAWELPLSLPFCGGEKNIKRFGPGSPAPRSSITQSQWQSSSGTVTPCNHPWECAPASTMRNVFLNTPKSSWQGAEMDIPYDSLETHQQAPCPRSKGNQGRPQRNPRLLCIINLWAFVFFLSSWLSLRHLVKPVINLCCDLWWVTAIWGPQVITPPESDRWTRWPVFLRTRKKENFTQRTCVFLVWNSLGAKTVFCPLWLQCLAPFRPHKGCLTSAEWVN